jgi:hypothetical protein
LVEPSDDSFSSESSLGDLEEVELPVASPAPVWRGLFRFALAVMGFNPEGTDEYVEMCHLRDRRYRSVVGRGLSDFLKAMFNTCSTQRPLYANLAHKLETAVEALPRLAFRAVCTHSSFTST